MYPQYTDIILLAKIKKKKKKEEEKIMIWINQWNINITKI